MEPHIEFLSKNFNPGEESYFHRERNNVRDHALIWKLDSYSEMERHRILVRVGSIVLSHIEYTH